MSSPAAYYEFTHGDCCTAAKMIRSNDQYTCQSRTVAGGSILSVVSGCVHLVQLFIAIGLFIQQCTISMLVPLPNFQVASLCAFGVGMWLLIYSQDFVELVGIPVCDGSTGAIKIHSHTMNEYLGPSSLYFVNW